MQPGRLDKRAQILELSPDLEPEVLASRWVSVRAKDTGDVAEPSGLRTAAQVEVRAWFSDLYQARRYLRIGSRLLVIADPRDPIGNRSESVMTCYELSGMPASYQPAEGTPKPCRVHLTHEAPVLDEMQRVTAYKTRAEVAVIEVGRPQPGDQLVVDGELYNVTDYADDTDDGVVRGLWLERP